MKCIDYDLVKPLKTRSELKQKPYYINTLMLFMWLMDLYDYEPSEHVVVSILLIEMMNCMCKLGRKWIATFGQEEETWRKLCMMNTFRETRYMMQIELLCVVDLLLICVDGLR